MRKAALMLFVFMAPLGCQQTAPARRPVTRVEPVEPPPVDDVEPVEVVEDTPDVPVIRLAVEDETAIDAAVRQAIGRGDLPGAVVLVGRRDGVVFRRAYGDLRLSPTQSRMRVDALFDLASVTKLFTAVAALRLVESGRLRLDSPVDPLLPELAGRGITVHHLLTHTAGLRSVDLLSNYDADRRATMERVLRGAPEELPGAYRYSDLGYVALGELVARVMEVPYDRALRALVLEPLGLEARFNPGASDRVVPTERAPRRGDPPPIIHGDANDPRAWRLGGIAGHAGLFATADDMSKLAEALLGARALLSDDSRRLLATPIPIRARNGRPVRRSLGADMELRSAEGWSPSSFGHGGYTGTWLWVDPERDLYTVILASRVHPDGGGRAGPIRATLGRLLAAALPRVRPPAPNATRLGIDVLRANDFESVAGKRIALLTNDAARARDGARTWELLRDAPNVSLVRVFTPEHGLGADREGAIGDASLGEIDVVSLFGANRRPDPEKLRDVDLVVAELQDVGARFYTYGATLGRMLEVAAEVGVPTLVLDRPNPIDGVTVSGPVLQEDWRSFVNHQPGWPVRHGLTFGEIARLLRAERGIEVELEVVPLERWQRDWRWPETGLRWVPPSPNLRTPSQVLLYPGVALVEGTNVSVGRGTDRPFQQVGAPWMDPPALLAALPAAARDGLMLSPTRFRPTSARHRNAWCPGIAIEVEDVRRVRPVRFGLALLEALRTVHAEEWDSARAVRIVGDARVMEALGGHDVGALEAIGERERAAFEARRREALLY